MQQQTTTPIHQLTQQDFQTGLQNLPKDNLATLIATLELLEYSSFLLDKTTGMVGNSLLKNLPFRKNRKNGDTKKEAEESEESSARVLLDSGVEDDATELVVVQKDSAEYEEHVDKIKGLQKRIEDRKNELMCEHEEVLRYLVRACICEKLKIKANLQSSAWFDDVILKVASAYGVAVQGWDVPQVAARIYQLGIQEILTSVQQQFENLSAEERARVEAEINARLRDMNAEQQEALRKDLGVDKLTANAMITALSGGASVVAAASGASAAGFGLYLAATTMMHAIATTLFGMTLSFGFYTGLTSLIAFFLNPIVVAVMAVGVFSGIHWGQGDKFAQKIVGMVLIQVFAVSAMRPQLEAGV